MQTEIEQPPSIEPLLAIIPKLNDVDLNTLNELNIQLNTILAKNEQLKTKEAQLEKLKEIKNLIKGSTANSNPHLQLLLNSLVYPLTTLEQLIIEVPVSTLKSLFPDTMSSIATSIKLIHYNFQQDPGKQVAEIGQLIVQKAATIKKKKFYAKFSIIGNALSALGGFLSCCAAVTPVAALIFTVSAVISLVFMAASGKAYYNLTKKEEQLKSKGYNPHFFARESTSPQSNDPSDQDQLPIKDSS